MIIPKTENGGSTAQRVKSHMLSSDPCEIEKFKLFFKLVQFYEIFAIVVCQSYANENGKINFLSMIIINFLEYCSWFFFFLQFIDNLKC